MGPMHAEILTKCVLFLLLDSITSGSSPNAYFSDSRPVYSRLL